MDDHPLFTQVREASPELISRATAKEWAPDVVDRALRLRVPMGDLEAWLGMPWMTSEQVSRQLDDLERVFCGPLRNRQATWRDAEALVDLYADAPEDVGEWRLVVERGPNPYAQFRLQEHVNLPVIECRGVLLAVTAHSARNTIIAGERTTAHLMSAWRVRDGFRGMRLSRLLQMTPGPATAWFGLVTYWYERSDNASGQGWLDKVRTEVESRGENSKVSDLSATVHHLEPLADEGPRPAGLRVRPIEPADVPRCVELINATHDGLDLFRPYTVDFLETHLDDPSWGPKPWFWAHVFGWDDFWVVDDTTDASVVACGGLWDRGRDVREVWTHRESGEQQMFAPTALLDWGYAPDREDAMEALVRHLLVRTAELDRSHLVAPLEYTPALRSRLEALPHRTETRAMKCMGFHEGDLHVEPQITRPYTDLAYW